MKNLAIPNFSSFKYPPFVVGLVSIIFLGEGCWTLSTFLNGYQHYLMYPLYSAYPYHLAIAGVMGIASAYGLWTMKKWGVFVYLTVMISNLFIWQYLGVLNPYLVSVHIPILLSIGYYFKRMI